MSTLVAVHDIAMTFDVSPSLLTRVIERQPKLFLPDLATRLHEQQQHRWQLRLYEN